MIFVWMGLSALVGILAFVVFNSAALLSSKRMGLWMLGCYAIPIPIYVSIYSGFQAALAYLIVFSGIWLVLKLGKLKHELALSTVFVLAANALHLMSNDNLFPVFPDLPLLCWVAAGLGFGCAALVTVYREGLHK